MTGARHGLDEVPLALQLSFEGDPPLHLRLDHLPCPAVVRSLALGLLDITNARGGVKSNWTARHYRNAIARFARWLEKQGFQGDLSDLTVDHLYGYGQGENVRMELRTRALLRAAGPSAGVTRPVSEGVLAQLDGQGVSTNERRSVPLAAYTPGEYERLTGACRAEIADWENARVHRAPGASVVLSFRILIGLELGIPSESVDALRLDDLRWQGDRDLHLSFMKRRADGPQAMNYRTHGPWSGAVLLTRWITAAEPARSRADDPSTDLWLWATPAGLVERARFSDVAWQHRRRVFLRCRGVLDDDGAPLRLDLRRLRTTWVQRKSKQWHGAVTVDPNHSARIEGDHYLTRSADRDEVDATIESAQRDLLRRADAVALVLTDDSDLADAVDDPGMASMRTTPQRGGWDMFAAACRDPYSSPFGPKGDFCTAAVWSCLVCPLALITPSKLPALLRMHDYLQEQSAEVTQSEWLRIYGPAWVQLTTRILPKFNETTLAEARRTVESNFDLPVPPDPFVTQ